jgi:hypothetical protein
MSEEGKITFIHPLPANDGSHSPQTEVSRSGDDEDDDEPLTWKNLFLGIIFVIGSWWMYWFFTNKLESFFLNYLKIKLLFHLINLSHSKVNLFLIQK